MKKLCLILVVLLAACKKYEEGGSYMINSRQPKKVSGEWALQKRLINEVESPLDPSIKNFRLSFERNGLYRESYTKGSQEVVTQGTWSKDSGVENYNIETEKGTIRIKVLRLKRNELWFSYVGFDQNIYQYHLIDAKKTKD